jgi:Ulp1 family protease
MTQCKKCLVFFKNINKHRESKCLENQKKPSNTTNNVSQLINESNLNLISNVGISHMNNELLDILLKKIDGIANTNNEIISKIELLNSKINDIEQKLNLIECINVSVVKDSNSQFSKKRSNSDTNKLKNQYISTNSTNINRTKKSKVNKKLYIMGLNEKCGNDQYHMIKIFNWLSCHSPISTKRIKDKRSNSQIVLATFYSQKTVKLALENANRLEKLFGYENVFLFEKYSDVNDKLNSIRKVKTKEHANQSSRSIQSTKQSNITQTSNEVNQIVDLSACSNQISELSYCNNTIALTPDESAHNITNSTSEPNPSKLKNCDLIAVKKKGKSQIDQKDYDTLEPGEMLNDSIVNSYLTLIERSDTICLSSFLAYKFLKSDYPTTEKWFKGKGEYSKYDLNAIKQIIIPICQDMHWTLIIVDVDKKSYLCYNSASTTLDLNKHTIDLILNGIFHNFNNIKAKDFNKKLTPSTIPKQTNGFDCGMFICLYARYYLLNDDFTFDQSMINSFRSHFKVELENMKLNNIAKIDSHVSSL